MFFHTVKLLQEAQDSNDGQDWDEEDELAYIENGEPLLQNVDNRFARSPKGRYTPASLLLALPFVAIVWYVLLLRNQSARS